MGSRGGWACADGQCILASGKCDGFRRNCRDGSDESAAACGDDCGGIAGGAGFRSGGSNEALL